MKQIFRNILDEFKSLPKTNSNPTFMDICQMQGDRFEERCSQVLKFYLNPNAEHKMKGLFLNSLLELLGESDTYYDPRNIKVLTEEMTYDRKFIDVTVVSDDFVIAIENKIGAELYNPLGSYINYIKSQYKNASLKHFVVLSVRKIIDSGEIKKMKKYGYIYINYQDFFACIKKNFGFYVADCDQSYLTFLLDFIRTIENRYYNNNMEMKRFFYENQESIEKLIEEYNRFRSDILQLHKENIRDIKSRVEQITGVDWWVYQGWDLGIDFNRDTNRLGIESSFSEGDIDNPLGAFHIYITVWSKKHFIPYEKILKETFPDCFIDYEQEGRVYLRLPAIKDNNHDEIAHKLSEYFNIVKSITDRIK